MVSATVKWTLVALVIAGAIAGFLIANDPDLNGTAFFVYFVLILISGLAYVGLAKFLNLTGVMPNQKKDTLFGLGLGALFIILAGLSTAFIIGIPQVPVAIAASLTIWGAGLIIILLAPIAEEIFFRGVIQKVGEKLLKNFWLATILQISLFSIYHFAAYGASLEGFNAGFFGAAIFGFASTLLVRYTNNLLPSILAHMTFNSYLYGKRLGII